VIRIVASWSLFSFYYSVIFKILYLYNRVCDTWFLYNRLSRSYNSSQIAKSIWRSLVQKGLQLNVLWCSGPGPRATGPDQFTKNDYRRSPTAWCTGLPPYELPDFRDLNYKIHRTDYMSGLLVSRPCSNNYFNERLTHGGLILEDPSLLGAFRL
jgi:hypothetical protein